MIIFSWLTKFFKKPLPRAHQPVSESTCSSRRWEVEVGVERGEERHSQPGIGAFQVSPCVAHGLQASLEPHQLNAPPRPSHLRRLDHRLHRTAGDSLARSGQEGSQDSAQTARLLPRLRPLPGPLCADGGEGAAAGK